jgi:hypothetical protein
MTDTSVVPAGRVLLGTWALVVTVVSALTLIVCWKVDAPYLLSLTLWFIFCLAFGHWVFCRSLSLTMRDVRLIDYLYLGAGAVSVLLATASYEETRAQYAQMFFDTLVLTDRQSLSRAIQEQDDICGDRDKDLQPASYCPWISSLKALLANNSGAAELEAWAHEGRRFLDKQQWDSWPTLLRLLVTASPDKSSKPTAPNPFAERGRQMLERQYEAGIIARAFVRSVEVIVRNETAPLGKPSAASGRPPEPYTVMTVLGGVSRYSIWPFLLMFALAVRFIKVTAEVTGWIK